MSDAIELRQAIEGFIDVRFAAMSSAPITWGTPLAIECQCLLLVEMWDRFCRDGEPRYLMPAGDLFLRFARKRLAKKPGGMTLTQWFTDPKWGGAKGADTTAEHEACEQIVDFFVAWKADLKRWRPT